jgi:hypothetical protein
MEVLQMEEGPLLYYGTVNNATKGEIIRKKFSRKETDSFIVSN